MSKSRFIFDLNKCVGCMACVVGCSIENQTSANSNWRSVHTFNPFRHPDLPLFHLSLACNHCEEAPCLSNCPALAYTRNPETGHIVHHPEACIGCQYCTWACPYDAPKYNPGKGIIEKCTFCASRLEDKRYPACVDACPVGALGYEETDAEPEPQYLTGFTEVGVKPSIRLIPLRKEWSGPMMVPPDPEPLSLQETRAFMPVPASKVKLKNEWVLWIFTLGVPLMAAWIGSMLIQTSRPAPWLFTGAGMLLLVWSTLHLGRKERAWRALLHLRSSWLSREILTTAAFMIWGCLFVWTSIPIFGWLSVSFALLSLISVDLVYSVLKRRDHLILHSSWVLFTAILYFGLFSANIFLIGFSLTFKAGLYIYRKLLLREKEHLWVVILSVTRLTVLLLPLIYLGLGWFTALPYGIMIGLVITGEAIDRAQFYIEADLIHPARELDESLHI